VGSIENRLRRLEKDAREEMIEIPPPDGTVKKFPQSAAPEALLSLTNGRDHPLAAAARSSSSLEWRRSFFFTAPIDRDAKDLSS
jgi:hypothetical protein